MSDERPEALLKSALEKIVYFEARSSQVGNDLEQARGEELRLKHELASAAQREIELRRAVAELEVRSSRAHSEREEAARMAEALRRERADLIGKILEASRIHGAGLESSLDTLDLASFIAELRSEVVAGRAANDAARLLQPLESAPPRVRATAVPTLQDVAESLQAQGRLTVSSREMAALENAQAFAGRSEETLFGFSVRELSAPDASARLRAAERLKALGHSAAAPALATALHAETEPGVIVGLLSALAAFAKLEAVPVVQPHLASPHADVRIAALKALLALDATQAGPHLSAAMKDPDRSVRRRASLLALGLNGAAALELGTQAIRDADSDVRSLAALVLGASGDEAARGLLMDAMRDRDTRVRHSAGQALSRLLGQDVMPLVDLDESQRRREVRRLAQVVARPMQGSISALDALRARLNPQAAVPVPSPGPASRTRVELPAAAPRAVAAHGARSQVAVVEREAAPPAPQVLEAVLGELRVSIRGRPLEELALGASASLDEARVACAALLQQGLILRRGLKYFVA